MGELDAAGDVMTGGLIARAVESHGGEGSGGHLSLCLNCGTRLLGAHCHGCGQSGHIHRSFGAIGHEILHGVAHFEGKLWRTLPLLAWRPGELTRRYIAGERARFVSPMAIFLFSIFTMFAAFSIAGIAPPADIRTDTQAIAGFEDAAKRARSQIENAKRRRDALPVGDPRRAEAETDLRDLERATAGIERIKATVSGDSTQVRARTGWKRLDKGIKKATQNPGLTLYKLQSNSYKFSWLLIPLSLPFVWLMFAWKRKYHAYDHAVFVTYSIAFMSLLFISLTVASAMGLANRWLLVFATVVPFVHITRQLKQAYQLRWWSATLRGVLLSLLITGLILPGFLLLLLLLGLIG